MEVLKVMATLIGVPLAVGFVVALLISLIGKIPVADECDNCGGPIEKKYLRMILRQGFPLKVVCLQCLKRMPQEMKSELQMLEAA